jgi:hypothetical protein
MATIGSAKATLVNKIDSLTSSATAKDTIFLAKALKENSSLNNFVWQGNWAATTAYSIDDVVASGGNTYMCKAAHTSGSSFALGSDWDMMAGAGTNGTNGADGADGTDVGTGTAGQVLKTNAAADGVEWGTDGGLPSGGTVGQVVTNTGSGAGDWADAAGGGKVLQVTSAESQTPYSSSSSTFSDMFEGTITPSSSSSKILVTVNVASCLGYHTPDKHLEMELHRNGTRAYGLSQYTGGNPSGSGGATGVGSVTLCVLDNPGTTSELTYKLRMRSRAGNSYVRANASYSANSTSSIVLTEIGA